MNEENKLDKSTEAVYKLNKLTAENKLKWRINDLDSTENDDNLEYELSYLTEFSGKKLRLTHYKKKEYRTPISIFFSNKEQKPKLYIISFITLDLITEGNKSLYNFKASKSSLEDLFETVKIQTSGAQDLLDEILKVD